MKFRDYVVLLVLFTFTACSNNEVSDTFKQKQYSIIKGLNASQEGKYSVAIGHLLNAYAIDSKDIFTLRELALNYGKSGDFKNSERFYVEMLAISPNDSGATYNLGTLYYNQKKYKESLNILERVNIENVTNDIKSLIAYNYYSLEEYEKAYTKLKGLESVKKDDLYFAKVYGDTMLKTKRLGQLHPYITKLYEEKPGNLEITYIYAKHLNENLGKSSDAIGVLEQYIINYGVYKEINLEAARISMQLNDFDNAKKYLVLLPERYKYEEDYLKVALEVYTGLNDSAKVNEIETVLKKITKE